MHDTISPRLMKSSVSYEVLVGLIGTLMERRVADITAIQSALNDITGAIKELKDRPQLEYAGTWDQAKVFGSNKFVSHAGSMWLSSRASVGERPGSGDAWLLVVKRGKDGR